MQKVNQKYSFTQTDQTQLLDAIFIFSSTVTELNAQDFGISKAAKDTSKIDQMKVSHETGSEANFGFGHALMPS